MYSCVIQQDGAVAHNFIPARRMSDGMVGMYDSVTEKFHVSPNGNKFTADPAVLSKLRLGCGDSGYAYDFSTSTLDVDAGILVSFMESGSLAGDCDMRKFQDLEIEEGATIDLAGHKLYVHGISGSGTITDSVGTELSGYERIEYIQASGTQHIDTGYVHDNSTKVDMRIKFDSVSPQYQSFYGSRNSTGEAAKGFSLWLNYAKFRRAFGAASAENIDSHTVTTSTIYDIHLEKSGDCTATPEGGEPVNLGTGTQGGSLSPHTDHIFAINQYIKTSTYNGWRDDYHTSAKLYSCKIYSGDTLVRDFVPVRRTRDGVLGLLDLAQGRFYVNTGRGTFAAGPDVETVVAGGELHIDVADVATCDNSSVTLRGCFKLVKDGAGTLVMSKASQGYACGTEITSGTMKPGTSSLASPCGAEGTTISASAGGTVDFNGNANMQTYVYDFADGEKALNTGSAISSGVFTFTSFYTPVSTGAFTALLADGSTLDVSEWPTDFPVASTAAAGSTKISFAADSTITVRFGSKLASSSTPLVSWPSKPSDIDTVRFTSAPGENKRNFVAKDDGLYALSGFTIPQVAHGNGRDVKGEFERASRK